MQFLEDLGRCLLGQVSDSDDTGQFAVYGHEHSHFTLGAGHLPILPPMTYRETCRASFAARLKMCGSIEKLVMAYLSTAPLLGAHYTDGGTSKRYECSKELRYPSVRKRFSTVGGTGHLIRSFYMEA